MTAYYNDNDPYCVAWLRNLILEGLIPWGEVDERSVTEIEPDDLRGFTQCHFFAGLGGWAYALQLAGWPEERPVWTGSCPCQPFSSAARGRGEGFGGARDLWPYWLRLLRERQPATIFGEQVAGKAAWLDRVCDDVEAMGYAIRASVLPACSVGFDHARPRIYFACHSYCKGQSGGSFDGEVARVLGCGGDTGSLVSTHGVPARVAKLRALGNAIVPQVAAAFIEACLEAELFA